MISVKHTITEEERSALDRVRKLLNLRQGDLAERIGGGIEQNWISQTLSGKRKIRRTEDVEKLSRTLLEQFESERSSFDLDPSVLETLLMTLKRLAYLSTPMNIPGARIVTAPGRPVPSSAANYIDRNADEELEEYLRFDDFSFRVAGPVQSGRTSLLLKLADKATQKHFVTDYLSAKDVIWEGVSLVTLDERERERAFLQWLKERLANHWRLPLTIEDRKVDFASWISRRLRSDTLRKYLLIVDDISVLEKTAVNNVLHTLRTARNGVSTFSVALGLNAAARSAVTSSLFFAELIELSWFDLERLKTLAGVLERTDVLKSVASKETVDGFGLLFERYGGQPLLSHFAIANIQHFQSKSDFLKQCNRWENESVYFRSHRKLVRQRCEEVLAALSDSGISDATTLLRQVERRGDLLSRLRLDADLIDTADSTLSFRNSWYKEIVDEQLGALRSSRARDSRKIVQQ